MALTCWDVGVELRGFEPLTSCMPWPRHPLTPPAPRCSAPQDRSSGPMTPEASRCCGRHREAWPLATFWQVLSGLPRCCGLCRMKGARPPHAPLQHPAIAPHQSRSATMSNRGRVVVRVASRGHGF
jgi:hypothetical protein